MKYLYRLYWYFAYVYWIIKRPEAQGTNVIVENSGSVLMVRHTYGHRNHWYFPGGGRKKNEDFQTTAAREIKEELGLDLQPKFIGQLSGFEDWKNNTIMYYSATASNDKITIDNKEIREYKWWPKEALPSAVRPLTKEAIEKFVK